LPVRNRVSSLTLASTAKVISETRFLGWLLKVGDAVSEAMPLGLSHFSWMGDRELNPDCINI
jgi:hypothetical protein